MYAAIFELDGGYKMQFLCKGDCADALFDAIDKFQSLGCLVNMGRARENAEGIKELDKLECIIDKRNEGNLTVEDLTNLDVTLSIGSIKCIDFAEGDNADSLLKAKYPKAM